MPLVVRPGTIPPSTQPWVPRPPVTVDVDTIYAEWIAPDGVTVLPLTSPGNAGWFTTGGIGGWGAVPVSRVDDPSPRGGVVTRHVRDEPRSITWPLYVWGDTNAEFTDRMREVVDAFTMTKDLGPGTLRVTRRDGSAREILAIYEDGLGGDVGQGYLSARPVLTLFCPNGFWRSTRTETVPRSYSVGSPYLDRYLTVSSGQVLGASRINNPGQTDAWPSWVITGPAQQVIATNHRTGESFTLTHNLGAGQTITITTDPPTVRGPAGEVFNRKLNWPDAELWPLKRGANDVDFVVSGSGIGTSIVLSYVPRYEMW